MSHMSNYSLSRFLILLGSCEACVAPLLLATGRFRFAMFAAKKCIVVTTDLIGRLRLHLRHLLPATVFVNGDEDKIGAGDMEMRSGLRILDPDLHADFQRRVECTIDA